MKIPKFLFLSGLVLAGSVVATLAALPGGFERVSLRDSSQPAPAGGGGDSILPVISADGHYVLFASTANNLVASTNGNPVPVLNLPRMNVFLRDRGSNATTLVSVNRSGLGGGNGDSVPIQISTNGQFVLFESTASDLVANDTNGASDVFWRDLANGLTFLVSTNSNGGGGNGISRSSTMTPDGRYVAFVSTATNLVAGDTNRIADVFVRDMQTGITVMASRGAMPTNSTILNSFSEAPDLTPDGRYVAFFSSATNLVPGVNKAGDVYVRDLVANTTVWASVDARTLLGNQNAISYNHTISADGNFIAYEVSTNVAVGTSGRGLILRYNLAAGTTDLVHTNATVLCASYDEIRSLAMTPDGRFIAFLANTNGASGVTNAVCLWDAQSATTTLASVDLNGNVPAGNCLWPSLDSSGRYVGFLSTATNLVTNALAGAWHLYVRDTQAATTRLVAVDANGTGIPLGPATAGTLSADGTFMAFEAMDTALTTNDRNHDYDVFLRDLTTDPSELISSHDPVLPAESPNGTSIISSGSISFDGRFVAFASDADNLIANDTNGCTDVFVRDRLLSTNLLVSAATNGAPGDFSSMDSSISSDGRYVAFTSGADNLVPGDGNQAQDVFLRDLQASTSTLISVNTGGSTASGNAASYSPRVSSDGRFVLFRSKASNLAAGPFTVGSENLFLRDLQLSATYALTRTGVVYSAMSSDGRLVAFANTIRVYLWDSLAAALLYSNSFSQTAGLALSPDGNRLVYWSGASASALNAVDRATGSNWVITTAYATTPDLQFDSTSRFLTYPAKSAPASPRQIYLYDFSNRCSLLVSRNLNTGGNVNSNCDSPAISVDARLVVYRSGSTDIVPQATNGIPQLYAFDRLALTTALLTTNRPGTGTGTGIADNRSLAPVFSGDGQTLFFQSYASDLAVLDFNHTADIFAWTLLHLTITDNGAGGQAVPSLSWAAVPGAAYRVEYKDDLADAAWHDASSVGTINIVGLRASFSDLSPAANQRFYRVTAF